MNIKNNTLSILNEESTETKKPSFPDIDKITNVSELRNERDKCITRATELMELRNDGKVQWTTEQREEFKTINARQEYIENKLKDSDDSIIEQYQAATVVSNIASVSSNFAGLRNLAGGITVKPRFEDDPKHGFKNNRDFMLEVANLYRNGGTEDHRLRFVLLNYDDKARSQESIRNAVGSDEYARGNWESAGVFVPEELRPGVLTTEYESDFLSAMMQEIPMSAPIIKINARVDKDHRTKPTGGTVAYRRAETKTIDFTKQEFEQVELKPTAVMVASATTNELMRDSPISIPAIIEMGAREAGDDKRLEEYLFGNGQGTPLGMLHASNPALITVKRANGQATGDIVTGQNVLKIAKHVWKYATSAVWFASIDLYEILATLVIESPNAAGIIRLFNVIQDGNVQTYRLWGRPLIFTEHLPGVTVGQDGNVISEWNKGFLSCCNPSQMLRGTRYKGNARSIHVRFMEREEVFIYEEENDARPWWKSTIKPRKGITELSPFAVLDTATES